MNIAVTETATEIFGKHRRINKPWVTSDILDLCHRRKELKKKKGDTKRREIYKKVNTEIRNIMKKTEREMDQKAMHLILKTTSFVYHRIRSDR